MIFPLWQIICKRLIYKGCGYLINCTKARSSQQPCLLSSFCDYEIIIQLLHLIDFLNNLSLYLNLFLKPQLLIIFSYLVKSNLDLYLPGCNLDVFIRKMNKISHGSIVEIFTILLFYIPYFYITVLYNSTTSG